MDEEATKAKAAISQASTNNDVIAKTSSVTTISSIQPDIVKKAEAKKQLKMK